MKASLNYSGLKSLAAHLPQAPSITASGEQLLTEADLATMLKTSQRAVQAWRTRGGGPPFIYVGRLVRYTARAVDTWIASRTRVSTSDEGA